MGENSNTPEVITHRPVCNWPGCGTKKRGLETYFCKIHSLWVGYFNNQLCRSYINLYAQFPDCRHILPKEAILIKNLSEIENGSIIYLPASNYQKPLLDTETVIR